MYGKAIIHTEGNDMTTITDFAAWSASQQVKADAHGNNVAFSCLNCGGPVLATLMANQRGSSSAKPTRCRSCGSSFWVEAQPELKRLQLHRLPQAGVMRYVAGQTPQPTSSHNLASWGVISAMLAAYGGATYDDLVAAVRQHDHHDGGKGFVDYCISRNWLQPA